MKNIFKKEKLNTLLPTITKAVDPVIRELLFLNVEPQFKELVEYQISTGGKRLRPALAIAGCLLLGGKLEDVLYPAAGLEILHNYSLIIDDIIDDSHLRRGLPTTWSKFGKSITECIGMDYAASLCQAAYHSQRALRISSLFFQTLKTLVSGEIKDILFERSGREEEPYISQHRYQNISEKDYLKMVSRKTAALFQTCGEVGAVCAEAKEKEVDTLKQFGFNLGMAFQIQDDILDIFGEGKTFGKEIGKDIKERKGGNIIIIFALKELNPSEKSHLLEIIKKKQISRREMATAVELIKKTKAKEKASLIGKQFIEKAQRSLEVLPQNKWNSFLGEIAQFTIQREK